MVSSLIIDRFELSIIRGHSRRQFIANRNIVEYIKIIFGRFIAIVSFNKPLKNPDDVRNYIGIALLIRVKLRDSVHRRLTRDKVEEMIAFSFNPCFYGEGQVKLNDDSGQELIVSSAGVAASEVARGVGDFIRAFGHINAFRVFAGLYAFAQAVYVHSFNLHAFPP